MAEKKNFEKTLAELEATVSTLEVGDVPLEEAISLFEKGVKLTKSCQKLLDEAEQKVSRLTESENDTPTEEAFV